MKPVCKITSLGYKEYITAEMLEIKKQTYKQA